MIEKIPRTASYKKYLSEGDLYIDQTEHYTIQNFFSKVNGKFHSPTDFFDIFIIE